MAVVLQINESERDRFVRVLREVLSPDHSEWTVEQAAGLVELGVLLQEARVWHEAVPIVSRSTRKIVPLTDE